MGGLFKHKIPGLISQFLAGDHVLFQLPETQTELEKRPVIKRLSLTFNDGPTPFGTPALLKILDQYQIKATFFLLGQNVICYPRLVTEILDAGHAIGNHSFSHLDPWKHSVKSTLRDLQKSIEILEQFSTQPIRWYRPPFGRITGHQVAYAQRYGLKTVAGSMTISDDQPTARVKRLSKQLLSQAKDRAIISFHDSPEAKVTPQVLRETLPRFIDTGWQFETLNADAA